MTASMKGNNQRLPDSTKLSEEAIQARRRYQKNYRANNPDKCRQWEKNKWERRARKERENDAE